VRRFFKQLAKKQMEDPAFQANFVNKETYSGVPEERIQDYAIVSIKVPKGVTIQRGERKITSPSQATIMVTLKGSEATPDTTPPETWKAAGGWAGQ